MPTSLPTLYHISTTSLSTRLPAYAWLPIAVLTHALDQAGGIFDLVLVDGRFRVACALKALQHVAVNSTVLVHDFYRADDHGINREHYAMLLDWYDAAPPGGGTVELAVLTPKPEALVAAAQLSQKYVAALNSEELVYGT